jgi:biotin-(acetyl-CoA carboxylase) ligase
VVAPAAVAAQEADAAQRASWGAAPAQPGTFTAPHSALIIGIGVNVNRPDAGAFKGAAYLNDGADGVLPLEGIAAAAVNGFFGYQARWLAAGGSFAPFVDEYRGHMVLLGEQACVRDATGAEIASGTAEGIDADGRLLLRGALGVVAVVAGEVTLRDNSYRI